MLKLCGICCVYMVKYDDRDEERKVEKGKIEDTEEMSSTSQWIEWKISRNDGRKERTKNGIENK